MADDDLAPALDVLRERIPGLQAVYLFGSEAAGTPQAESDVDLAVLGARPLGVVERFDLQEALAARLGRDVDLVDLHEASTVLEVQVVSTGRVLFDADPAAREAFEVRVLSAYALLNEERAVVLEAIARRGRVYG